MKVLVAVGSKYGSTRGIAKAIAEEIKSIGFEVDLEDACDVRTVSPYDAVIVGSAVYGGLWRRDASELVRGNLDELRARDVWMFSAGIRAIKEPLYLTREADELAAMVESKDHVTFTGALDYDCLNVGERAVIHAINPPLGDHRDLGLVRQWAHGIGVELLFLALS